MSEKIPQDILEAARLANQAARLMSSLDLQAAYIFRNLNGEIHQTTYYAQTPIEAAHIALIQTGQRCYDLLEVCKKTYVDEQAFWQSELGQFRWDRRRSSALGDEGCAECNGKGTV